jgi:hypothetical protein
MKIIRILASDNYEGFGHLVQLCIGVCVCFFFLSLQFYDVGQVTIINKNI